MEGEAARHNFTTRQHMDHRGQILINTVQQVQRIIFQFSSVFSVFHLCCVKIMWLICISGGTLEKETFIGKDTINYSLLCRL